MPVEEEDPEDEEEAKDADEAIPETIAIPDRTSISAWNATFFKDYNPFIYKKYRPIEAGIFVWQEYPARNV
jgi:hypothetical protein